MSLSFCQCNLQFFYLLRECMKFTQCQIGIISTFLLHASVIRLLLTGSNVSPFPSEDLMSVTLNNETELCRYFGPAEEKDQSCLVTAATPNFDTVYRTETGAICMLTALTVQRKKRLGKVLDLSKIDPKTGVEEEVSEDEEISLLTFQTPKPLKQENQDADNKEVEEGKDKAKDEGSGKAKFAMTPEEKKEEQKARAEKRKNAKIKDKTKPEDVEADEEKGQGGTIPTNATDAASTPDANATNSNTTENATAATNVGPEVDEELMKNNLLVQRQLLGGLTVGISVSKQKFGGVGGKINRIITYKEAPVTTTKAAEVKGDGSARLKTEKEEEPPKNTEVVELPYEQDIPIINRDWVGEVWYEVGTVGDGAFEWKLKAVKDMQELKAEEEAAKKKAEEKAAKAAEAAKKAEEEKGDKKAGAEDAKKEEKKEEPRKKAQVDIEVVFDMVRLGFYKVWLCVATEIWLSCGIQNWLFKCRELLGIIWYFGSSLLCFDIAYPSL